MELKDMRGKQWIYWWEPLVPTLGLWTGPEKETPMELKITAEKVRAAAETCPDTEQALKVLFPEAFLSKVPIPIFLDTETPTKGLIYPRPETQCFYLTPYPKNSVRKIKWDLKPSGVGWMLTPTYDD